MPEIAHTPAPPMAVPDGKRRLRNYLLDARFQLKFTGYILVIAVVIAGTLGAFLYTNSKALMREAELAVEARSKAAETSRELSNATLMNGMMNDDPVLAAALSKQSAQIDAQYDAEHKQIVQQRQELVRKQQLVWLVVVGSLVAFVVFIALATIVTTHRIVGPLFRIKRLVNEVAGGKLKVPAYPLRQSDELKDVFEAMTRMVQSLRDQQLSDMRRLEAAIDSARGGHADPVVANLQGLYVEMKGRIE